MNFKKKENNDKEEFLKSNQCYIYNKAQRIFILSIIGLIYGLAVVPYDIYNESGLWSYILDGLLISFSLIFLIKMSILKKKELNKYLLQNKKR